MSHNNYFEFKQFTVWQNRAAMRVGTDGVLLGAWASVETAGRILDIGTGTGLIALMLAQRCGAIIHAIDIEPGAYIDAMLNFSKSPWNNRLKVFRSSLEAFACNGLVTKFDAIVCNPPFFVNALKPEKAKRQMARHADSLSFTGLVHGVVRLLHPKGCFSVVLPTDSENDFIEVALHVGLHLSKITRVKPTPLKEPKRVLMEFRFEKRPFSENELTVETEQRHVYTPEFSAMVKDFYLAM